MVSNMASTGVEKCAMCPLFISKARMKDHMKMKHEKAITSKEELIKKNQEDLKKNFEFSDEEGDDFFEDKPQLKKVKPIVKGISVPSGVSLLKKPRTLSITPVQKRTTSQPNKSFLPNSAQSNPRLQPLLPKPTLNNPKTWSPKPKQPLKAEDATSSCPVCKKTMISKYLKYHMEATHQGAALPVSSSTYYLPSSSSSSSFSPKPSSATKTQCDVCKAQIPSKFMELHMSQYHRDAMLQQVKQQIPAPPIAMKPVKNYNFNGVKAKTYNIKPRFPPVTKQATPLGKTFLPVKPANPISISTMTKALRPAQPIASPGNKVVPFLPAPLTPPPPPLDPCPDCSGKFEARNMPLHQIQVHAPKTECSSCSPVQMIPSQLMELHLHFFHPQPQEEEKELELGDECELCDKKLTEEEVDMKEHLLVQHDVRVIEDDSQAAAEESSAPKTPVIKAILEPRKIMCHHCQKQFSTDPKLAKHIEKNHLDKCKICQVAQLLQENRVMDQAQLEKTFAKAKSEEIKLLPPPLPPKKEEVPLKHEDFYPARDVRFCEECEGDFHWRDFSHSCVMAAQDMRCVAGSIFYGAPKVPNPNHPQVEYEVVTSKVARTSMERLAKAVVTNHVNELVYDIVNIALEGEEGGWVEERGEGDKQLQLAAQALATRLLKKAAPIPNILQRAVAGHVLRSGPLDSLRRLSAVFTGEYEQELEAAVQEDRERIVAEREILQQEALHEVMQVMKDKTSVAAMFSVNTSVNTSYASPRPMKLNQPKRPSLFQKFMKPKAAKPILIINPNTGDGDFQMPTGSGLDLENKGYLKKIQHQLDKREEKNGKKVLPSSLPMPPSHHNTSLPSTPSYQSPNLPVTPVQPRPVPINPKLTNNPAISVNRVAPPPPPPPAPKRDSGAMERLKGLGLTVSVGQAKPQSPLAPSPHGSLSQSLPLASQIQNPVRKPEYPPASPIARYVPKPQDRVKQPVQKPSGKKPAEAPRPAPQKPDDGGFSDSQKLQLKSQILAYRLLARGQTVMNVVKLAATSRSLRSLGLPKEEMRSLSTAFNKEYSTVK